MTPPIAQNKTEQNKTKKKELRDVTDVSTNSSKPTRQILSTNSHPNEAPNLESNLNRHPLRREPHITVVERPMTSTKIASKQRYPRLYLTIFGSVKSPGHGGWGRGWRSAARRRNGAARGMIGAARGGVERRVGPNRWWASSVEVQWQGGRYLPTYLPKRRYLLLRLGW